jgi:hypothetical protein
VRDTGMPASHYACQSPLNKIGVFLHVTCLRDGVPLGSPTPQLKNRMGLGGLNSAGFPQIFRPFKGIICGDISEFESSHPSHAVRSAAAEICCGPRAQFDALVADKYSGTALSLSRGKSKR